MDIPNFMFLYVIRNIEHDNWRDSVVVNYASHKLMEK